jgi:MarR family transcriptional regulator, transcriptional regulator for hemolysin
MQKRDRSDQRIGSSPGHYINRISRLNMRWLEPRLEKLGLAVAQVPVFGALMRMGPLPQKELARLLHVEQPTMAQLLQRMERDGLVERRTDPNDGRSSLLVLTKLAVKRSGPARNLLAEGSRRSLAGFSADEVETLTSLLQRMLANLEEAVDS